MIKSKRKTTVYSKKCTNAIYKLDSSHNWDYAGNSNNMGTKYKSSNTRVNEMTFFVTKTYKQGLDIVDA